MKNVRSHHVIFIIYEYMAFWFVTEDDIKENYLKVKKDIQRLMEIELKKIKDNQPKKGKKRKNREPIAKAGKNKIKTQQKRDVNIKL